MNDIAAEIDIDLGDGTEAILARADTLRGDLRDRILERCRGMQKPWEKMSEMEQSQLIHSTDNVARQLVRDTLRLIAAQGRTVIDVHIDSLLAKDAIAAKLVVSRGSPGRYALLDAVKKDGLLVILDNDAFDGESAAAEPDPDQPDMLDDTVVVMDQTDAGGGAAEKPEADMLD